MRVAGLRYITALLFALGLLSTGFAPAPQSSASVRLSVNVGFDGYFRENAWVPVFVNVSNEGASISGELRVRTPGSGLTFAAPLELPTQSRKLVTLYVTLSSSDQNIQVQLTQNNILVAQAGGAVRAMQRPDVLFGVVTESTSGSVRLDQVRPFAGESIQAYLSIEQLPAQVEALRALDALFIGDADTGRLSPAQRQALADWVLGGGHLLIGGGPSWQRTAAGLGDLLPVTVDGMVTVEGLDALAAYVGRAGTIRAAPVVVTTGAARAGAEVLLALPQGERRIPLLVRARHGQGVVDYLAADPMTTPLAAWPHLGEVWIALLTSVDQRPSWGSGFGVAADSWARAQNAAEVIPFALPPSGMIAGFLAVYVLLIGPLNYLVLRRLKRRELAWLTIPLMIVLFSVVAYLTGFGLRGTRAIVNRLSVVQVWPDAGRAQVQGLIGLWSPFRTTYTVSAPEGYTLRPIPASGALAGLSTTRIDQGTAFTARDVPVNIGSVQAFVTQGFIDDPPALAADVTLTPLRGTDEAVARGAVANHSDFALEDAVILVRGNAWALGTLAPGEERAFSVTLPGHSDDAPIGAPPASLGLDYRYDARGSHYFGRTVRGDALTVQNILGLPAEPSSPSIQLDAARSAERDREMRRRNMLLNALVHEMHPTAGRGNNVFLAAWGRQAPVDVSLAGAEYTTIDSTLYLFQLPVTVDAPSQPVVIAPHEMSWVLSEASTRRDLIPYSTARTSYYASAGTFMLSIDDRVGFRFTPLPGSRPAHVTGLSVNLSAPSNAPLPGVALWDWTAGDWQVVAVDWGRNFIAGASRFVGPASAVEVLVFNPNDAATITLTRVDVTLYGVL